MNYAAFEQRISDAVHLLRTVYTELHILSTTNVSACLKDVRLLDA